MEREFRRRNRLQGLIGPCPVCELIRKEKVELRILRPKGKRMWPVEDLPVECPACHRTWESVRFLLNYWIPHWTPKIHAEVLEAQHAHFEDAEHQRRYGAWESRRIDRARELTESGEWTPRVTEQDMNFPT